jgi:G3E family GTPase
MDLVAQLYDICEMKMFDYIVIEASGICEPEPIAQTICSMPQLSLKFGHLNNLPKLDCIVTVVDALRMQSEFACGDSLKRKGLDEEDIENLIIQQIEFCNTILLNKISEVSAEDAARIKAIIRAIQPKANIIECDYADVDIEKLVNTNLFNFNSVATSATWINELERRPSDEEEEEAHHHHHHHDHDDDDDDDDDEHEHEHHHDHDDDDHDEHEHHHHHHHHHDDEGEAEEYGIQTFVYYRRAAFDINKFDYFVAKKWQKNIIRTKGLVYFSENTDMSYLFEQAGVQKKLTESGLWYATAPEEELKQMMLEEPGLARDWDPVYGDRMIKLVFIGQHLDRAALTADLDACLAK